VEHVGRALVREHGLSAERASGDDLDRCHPVAVAADEAQGVLAPFV
jgi:hypothetical protein